MPEATDLISIEQAREQEVARIRLPQWSDPFDHVELSFDEQGRLYPWTKLWCHSIFLGKSTIEGWTFPEEPEQILITNLGDLKQARWEKYWGPAASDRANLDYHRMTAAKMHQVPYAEVTAEQRGKGKALNYYSIYAQPTRIGGKE